MGRKARKIAGGRKNSKGRGPKGPWFRQPSTRQYPAVNETTFIRKRLRAYRRGNSARAEVENEWGASLKKWQKKKNKLKP